MEVIVRYPHVVFDAEDVPVIEGTRVPVWRLLWWHKVKGVAVDTLLKRYPQIKPAAVLSALAFSYDNESLVIAAYDKTVGAGPTWPVA